jgi:hypothetical protein
LNFMDEPKYNDLTNIFMLSLEKDG